MKSLMADSHRRLILAAVPDDGRVLEWGGGGTTLWLLERLTPRQHLVTVEHSADWHARLLDTVGHRDNWLPLRVPPAAEVGPNATPWEECPAGLSDYIHAADLAKPDVFLIDGVARGACLAAVLASGRRGATVFLHDAQPARAGWYEWAMRLPQAIGGEVIPHGDGEYPADLWRCRIQ